MKLLKRFLPFFLSLLLILPLLLCPVRADGDPAAPAAAEPFTLSSRHTVLMDADSKELLYRQNADEKAPIASTTKIMTAIVALESEDAAKTLSVPAEAVGVEGSGIYLYEKEELTLEQLLYALLLESANDAATAIAVGLCGSVEAFAGKMNEKAAEIGLTSSHFVNPHGLPDENHYSTAHDLALLTAYALENEEFARIVSTYRTEIPLKGGEGSRLLINHNRLLRSVDGCIGVKTGYTQESGRCLVSAARRDGMTLIAVTLDASDDWNDHKKLYEYGFAQFTRQTVLTAGGFLCEVPAVGAETPCRVTLQNRDAITLTLPKEHGTPVFTVYAAPFLYAPVRTDRPLGTLVISYGGKEAARVPLWSMQEIAAKKRSSFFSFLRDLFR